MSQETEFLLDSSTPSLASASPGLIRIAQTDELAQLVYEHIEARNGNATMRELVVKFGQDSSLRRVIRVLNQESRIIRSRAFSQDGIILQVYRVATTSHKLGGAINQYSA